MDKVIKFYVKEQSITSDVSNLVSNTKDVYIAQFFFDETWNGFIKNAVFQKGEDTCQLLLDQDDKCQIPFEFLEKSGYGAVGVYGTNETQKYPTIYSKDITIFEGVNESKEPTPPSPDIYEELLNAYKKAMESIAEEKKRALEIEENLSREISNETIERSNQDALLKTDIETINQTLPTLSLVSETGNKVDLEIDSTSYELVAKLYDKDNNLISTSRVIDLPLETLVLNVEYDSTKKAIIITLKDGTTKEVPVGDLVSGLVSQETFNTELAKKVDKVDGKSLLSDSEIERLATLHNYDDSEVKQDIENLDTSKQDNLIAGENIEINNNVISAKGGVNCVYATLENLDDDFYLVTLYKDKEHTNLATRSDVEKALQVKCDGLNEDEEPILTRSFEANLDGDDSFTFAAQIGTFNYVLNAYYNNEELLQAELSVIRLQNEIDLNKYVEKVEGKGLSTNDYTTEEKNKLSKLENYDDTLVKQDIKNLENNKANTDYVDQEDEKLKERIRAIEESRIPNVILSDDKPTINGSQMSGFSLTKYAKFPFLLRLSKPFDIKFEFTTASDVTNQQNIMDSDFGLAFAIRNARFVIALSTNGTSWNLGEGVGTFVVQPNTSYLVKISWDGNTYTMSYSLDAGQTYIVDITKVSSELLYPKQIYVGVGQSGGTILNYFKGVIDFQYASVALDGEIIYLGYDDIGVLTRMDRDMDNITDDGVQKVKDIIKNEGYEKTIDVDAKLLPINNDVTELKEDLVNIDTLLDSFGLYISNGYLCQKLKGE